MCYSIQACFQRVFAGDPFSTCDLIPLETKSIDILGNTIKIFSPDFGIENTNYPNNILCQYALPECPSGGSLVHISWFSEQFILQPEQTSGPFTVCSDFLRFFNLQLDLELLGVERDSFGTLCDQQDTFFAQFSGPSLLVSDELISITYPHNYTYLFIVGRVSQRCDGYLLWLQYRCDLCPRPRP